MIEVKNLKKYYGKNRGIENIDFQIKKGEVYGLIGPNGAGKTTTLRILIGLLKQDEGNIFFDKYELPSDNKEIKQKLGYLPGEVNFYGEMKIYDFLQFNKNFYINYDEKYEKYLLETLNIDTKKKFKELSLGNKKKIGILQSVVHNPDFLILDEPTNGLDPILQQKLYEIIELQRQKGSTILFSSHILSEVEKICDRVGIVKEGNLIKEFEIDELKDYSIKEIYLSNLTFINDLNKYNHKRIKDNDYLFKIKNKNLKIFFGILSKCSFDDIKIDRPKLEDIFIEYYK
ncbi:ABC transporter ATP-binding protein [Oceanotoga sp. DSM 15011]|jgi:ABC-2 type transport system ATP-binding protein|uniref:ABC-2 type transport system ATP-binding protein n=1 Tax=Oceanotoga teriensis TaxID=515440 RepID=A0AA45C7W4_9BACT|nr:MULTISPECIES: ABC transporter ATP-binding protein [Oceanotoga]MDN5341281.1 beta-exotoxin transport system ATP-binding protein [Oceanotoga sp.]MDO7976992.1 ABC transporter ATP-binding protein [Oceanotoga teriensis]PWJ95706.1 ABC-2 type transport system ATP-binding protein [Oceanotoga teriensis]UYO99540.1 ABC transporter ATP-binding protein [Oceanotoga sp. DSM 15011]